MLDQLGGSSIDEVLGRQGTNQGLKPSTSFGIGLGTDTHLAHLQTLLVVTARPPLCDGNEGLQCHEVRLTVGMQQCDKRDGSCDQRVDEDCCLGVVEQLTQLEVRRDMLGVRSRRIARAQEEATGQRVASVDDRPLAHLALLALEQADRTDERRSTGVVALLDLVVGRFVSLWVSGVGTDALTAHRLESESVVGTDVLATLGVARVQGTEADLGADDDARKIVFALLDTALFGVPLRLGFTHDDRTGPTNRQLGHDDFLRRMADGGSVPRHYPTKILLYTQCIV